MVETIYDVPRTVDECKFHKICIVFLSLLLGLSTFHPFLHENCKHEVIEKSNYILFRYVYRELVPNKTCTLLYNTTLLSKAYSDAILLYCEHEYFLGYRQKWSSRYLIGGMSISENNMKSVCNAQMNLVKK